jgi:hypothetical protein
MTTYKRDYKEEFNDLVESEGYVLLSEYKKDKERVGIKCPNGHIYKIKPNTFKNGCRCSSCPTKRQVKSKQEFFDMLYVDGYVITTEYVDVRTRVGLMCPKGHEWTTTPHGYKKGYRCSICAGNNHSYAKDEFLGMIEEEGYSLISDYINSTTRIKIKCPNGHEWDAIPSEFKHQYFRCPICAGSSGQRLLQEMLSEHIDDEVVYNDRKILGGLELDIYYPKLNIAIEYQGNYWHSLPEVVKRDERKRQLCGNLGIKLIEVWDTDFLNDKQTVIKYVNEERCLWNRNS